MDEGGECGMSIIEKTDVSQEITIDLEDYLQLFRDSHLLYLLKRHGVESWEGWDGALKEYRNGTNQQYEEVCY